MTKPPPTLCLFLLFLSLLTPPYPTHALLSFTQLRTAVSLSHSLFTRVANLRTARGDLDGAHRAKLLASKLDFGLGLGSWPTMWSMGWDYLKNYAWRDDTMSFRDALGFASDANELLSWLSELSRLRSDSQRATWVARNYKNVLRVSKSLLGRLSSVFGKTVRLTLVF